MTEFAQSWRLSRSRFLDEIKDLSQEQLNWRMQPGTLTIGEMALHVAGGEVSFISQLLGRELSQEESRIKASATDSVVNDKPFPFRPEEITPELVMQSLERAREIAEPVMENPSDEVRKKEIVSVLGPIITGEGALARLAFHPAYHQGQAYLMIHSPQFPR